MGGLTWSEAVQTLRDDPQSQELVRACYFDDPLIEAAHRFWHSEEWRLVSELLPGNRGSALDLGAGRGISSFALARDGWRVTSLEPDPSPLVGAEAIRSLASEAGLPIHVVSDYSETLPFPSDSFDLVHCRQSLHHAHDLRQTCREIGRVLKPSGMLIATREHVISKPEDLSVFLAQHPLHHLYGGENAFQLKEYQGAIEEGGLKLVASMAPFDSAINYFPASECQIDKLCLDYASRFVGRGPAVFLTQSSISGSTVRNLLRWVFGHFSQSPGRLYSFIAVKS